MSRLWKWWRRLIFPGAHIRLDGGWSESRNRNPSSSPPAPVIATLGLKSEGLLEKKGVTYCATCDGAWPMFRNQPLVVVGGGDSACEEAIYLTRFGSEVYLVHRRDTLRASKIMAQRVFSRNEKIKPVWDTEVTEILDCKLDKVTGVRLQNLKSGAESVLPCAGRLCRHRPRAQHGAIQGRRGHG